jgi:hypothetical protein
MRPVTSNPDQVHQRQDQIDQIYRAIGHFQVEFSQLVGAMEMGISAGIGGNYPALLCVLAEMTAYPLAQAWRSVLVQSGRLSEEEITTLKDLTAGIQQLIQRRNDWAHGTWYVGWGNDATVDWSTADLVRLKNTSVGLSPLTNLDGSLKPEDIEKYAIMTSVIAEAARAFSMLTHLPISDPTMRPGRHVQITRTGRQRNLEVTNGDKVLRTEWKAS